MFITLRTKAQTLLELKDKVVHSEILDMYVFTVNDWMCHSKSIIKSIQNKFEFVIVRSSSLNEDNREKTNAGKYASVLGVSTKKPNTLANAIDTVIDSYNQEINYLQNEILIQPMLMNISISGVAFTYDIENSLPYYVITFDKDTHLTNTITSGNTNNICTEKILRKSRELITDNKVLTALIELEKLTNNEFLDVEFAIDKFGVLYIFQVRQLILKSKTEHCNNVYSEIINNKTNYFYNDKYNNTISGNSVIYSNMVDWNPAELVGCHPPILNFSLYNKIFTNKVWAYGRKMLGYKDIGSINLIHLFWGHPYINVLFDFNSYLPAGLNTTIEEKVVEYYIEKLKENKNEHDKAEFNIVDTCFSVDFNKERYLCILNSFEIAEFEKKLKNLTNKILLDKEKIIEKTISDFNIIKEEAEKEIVTAEDVSNFINEMVNTLSLYYSIIVRCAFICYKQFLALKNSNYISQEELTSFFNSFSSVASEQINELGRCSDDASIKAFLLKYDCVKQNLFDITFESPYLDKKFIKYIKSTVKTGYKRLFFQFEKEKQINQLFNDVGLEFDLNTLCQMTKKSFYYREKIKYVISKHILIIFNWLKKIAFTYNIDYNDIAHISISDAIVNWNDGEKIKSIIKKNKYRYKQEAQIQLPEVITCFKDFYCFEEMNCKPNFITDEFVNAEIYYIKNNELPDYAKMKNKVIIIEHADPGYDWIFNCGILGFITKYGGMASHMALRAYEMSVPAVIGCGNVIFRELLNSKYVSFDCKVKSIKTDYRYIYC